MSSIAKMLSAWTPELPMVAEEGSLISLGASDPVAANDAIKLSEDDAVSLNPLSNDSDPLSGVLVIGLINGLAV